VIILKSVWIEPSGLQGRIRIPPSKSISHRAIICAGLAQGTSSIGNIILSEDIEATLEAISALGACVEKDPENYTLEITGTSFPRRVKQSIDCRESGSTLRFLIPLAALTGTAITLTGKGRLKERPLDEYYKIFDQQGIKYKTDRGFLPLTLEGNLNPGIYSIRGDVSSQFISGLLFALPLLSGNSKIVVTTEMESRGYIDLTIDILEKYGIKVENNHYREFLIEGNQKYNKTNYNIEGDYSQAAFWIVAASLRGSIDCLGLNPESVQGDRMIIDITGKMGAHIEQTQEGLSIKTAVTRGTVIDAAQCPDLVPVLAVLGAFSQGITTIVNAGRLRIKESDRLKAIATELNKLGAKVQEFDEGLKIEGVEILEGGTVVDSWNDHRIAMALAVAALKCKKPVEITGFEAVKKSYPHFWDDFYKLGGKIK